MDDSDREATRNALRERSPDWLGRPRAAPSAYRRPFWPRLDDSGDRTSWLAGAALVIVVCVAVMAVVRPILQQWRPAVGATAGKALAGWARIPDLISSTSVSAPASAPSTGGLEALDRRVRESSQVQADQRREAAIKQRDDDNEALRVGLELEARREREWQAAYQRPKACDTSLANVDSVGCANDYIRARRAFDERFMASTRR